MDIRLDCVAQTKESSLLSFHTLIVTASLNRSLVGLYRDHHSLHVRVSYGDGALPSGHIHVAHGHTITVNKIRPDLPISTRRYATRQSCYISVEIQKGYPSGVRKCTVLAVYCYVVDRIT